MAKIDTAFGMFKTLAVAAAFAVYVSSASAATIDWSGLTSTDWAADGNWVGGVAPVDDLTTDGARFNSTSYTNAPRLTADRSVNGLLVTTAGTGAVTLGGAYTLTLGSGGITQQASGGALTINSNVAIGANQTWTPSSTNAFAVQGTITQNAGTVWTMAGSRPVTFNGAIYLNSSAGANNLVHTNTNTTQVNGGMVLGADQKWSIANGSTLKVGVLATGAGAITGTGNLTLATGTSWNGVPLIYQAALNSPTFTGNYTGTAGGFSWTPYLSGNQTGSFGTGTITLSNASFNFYNISNTAGSAPVATITNNFTVTGSGTMGVGYSRVLGSYTYGITKYSGALSLGGALTVTGDINYPNQVNNNGGFNSPEFFTSGVTLQQSAAFLTSIAAGFWQTNNNRFTGPITDEAGTARNALVLSVTNGHRLTLENAGNTFANGLYVGVCITPPSVTQYVLDVPNNGVTILSGATAGAGNVTVVPGGRLYLEGTGAVASGKRVTVQSANYLGVLSLQATDPTPPAIASVSDGVLALNGGGSSGSAINTMLAGTVGNGKMFLGAMPGTSGSPTGATFTGSTLATYTDNVYRLGGGGGILTLDVPATTAGVLTGDKDVQVGSTKLNGSGTVTTSDANDFTGSLTVTSTSLGINTVKFYGTAQTGGASPFGSPTGPVTLQGGLLRLAQADSATSTSKGDLAFTSQGQVEVNANANNTTLVFDFLTRNDRGVLMVNGVSSSLGTRERIKLDAAAPTVTNGMVDPYMLNATGGANFVTYGINGFAPVTYSANTLNTPPAATDLINNTSAIALNNSPSVYALRTTAAITASTSDRTITIGSGGLITDGGFSIGAAGSPTVNLNFGSAEGILYSNYNTASLYGKISGTNGITKAGAGMTTLYNLANDFTGEVTINQGVLFVVPDKNDGTLGSLGSLSNNIVLNGGNLGWVRDTGSSTNYNQLVAGRTITLGPLGGGFQWNAGTTVDLNVNSRITGSGTFYPYSGGSSNSYVYLTNSLNDYTGGTVIAGAANHVTVRSTGKLGSGPVTVTNTAGVGAVYLTLEGNANLDYVDGSSNHTYLPVQTTTFATVNFRSAAPVMGSLSGFGNVITGNNTSPRNDTSLTVGLDNGSSVFGGVISDLSGTVTQGVGSLVKGGTGAFTLTGPNSYRGSTTVQAGVLIAGNPVPSGSAGPFGNASTAITLGNANTGADDVSLMAGNAFAIARPITISSSGSGLATVGGSNTSGTATYSGTLTLNRAGRLSAEAGGTVDFTGDITGPGSLTKVGDGVVTLTGTKSYTGSTFIDSGILRVSNAGMINNSAAVMVNAGGTLDYQNIGVVLSVPVTNNGGTVIMAPGASVLVAGGSNYAGYQSTSGVGLDTQLRLLDGTAGANNTIATAWRVRNSNETYPTQTYPPMPLGSKGLISDVVDFTGTGGDLYTLQLSYDPSQIVPGMTENELVSAGLLYLAYNNGTSFVNAGTTFVRNGAYIPGTDLTLGNWGVDTTNHVAWAVVDHNSQWAVVPEPGTLALLAFGALGVMNVRRKQKTA